MTINKIRFTNLTTTKSNFKLAAVGIALFAASFTSCKSSLEEDLAPSEVATDTAVPATVTDESAEKGSYHLKGYTLKQVFPFPIGAAVVKERLLYPLYDKTLKNDFNRLSSESDFKFHILQPEENRFVYTKADAIVAYAQINKMQVHGHTLIWALDGMTPRWVLEHKGGAAEFDQLLKNHITTVVNHFKGKVTSWDVVNEALTPDGRYVDNIWLRKLGEGYLLKAFKYASEADPQAKLFMNDFSQEYGGKKLYKYLQIAKDAKAQGIKIDGLGFQMHTVLRVDAKMVEKSFGIAASTGLLIHISEFDVALKYQMPNTFDLTDSLSRAQGAKVKEIVKAYMTAVPKAQQFGITTWGVGDKDSYFNKNYANSDHDYPLLFSKDYKAKWAYRGFIEAGLGR
jgi:endo-1,4-beta-xylanase